MVAPPFRAPRAPGGGQNRPVNPMTQRPSKKIVIPLMLALMTTPLAFAFDDGGSPPAQSSYTDSAAHAPILPDVSGVAAVVGTHERARAAVALLTDWQIEMRQEPSGEPVRVTYGSSAAALAALAARHGASGDPVPELPSLLAAPVLDAALARFVGDFLVFEAATVEAFGHLDGDAPRDVLARQGAELRLAPVMRAQESLFASALALQAALDATPVRPLDVLQVPGAYHLDLTGACNDDVYTENLPLIVDECGDDTYLNNAGGGGFTALVEPSLLAAALVDFDGHDRYTSGRAAAVNGGGFGGAGFLYDAAGDDAYLTPKANDGVNGGGSVGSGFLVDAEGNDMYEAGGWGTNGGGYIGGRGLLADMGGNDAYSGTHEAVNGGGGVGNGALWDDEGDDTYTASFIGVNGGAIGGSGLLYDRTGMDRYVDDVIGDVFDLTVVPKEVNGAQVDDA